MFIFRASLILVKIKQPVRLPPIYRMKLFIAPTAILFAAFAHSSLQAAPLPDLDRDGIANILDTDLDNDGLLNGEDRNVDGGIARSGPLTGRYIGDRYNNDDAREKDIDSDGLLDHSISELDIDGDGLLDSSIEELDIDGDGKLDSSVGEFDTDGDGYLERVDLDDDSDGLLDRDDDDDDGDGMHDHDDDDKDGAVVPLLTGPVGDGTAPAALTSLSYLLQRSGKSEIKRLNFITETTGAEVEGRKLERFTYTYAQSSAAVGVVTIIEEPGEYEVITLDFSSGIFTKQEFEHGRLEESKKGVFMPAAL